jgi:hypothetical protein
MRMALLIALLASSSLAQAKMIHVGPGGNAQEKLQTALIEAQPGDTRSLYRTPDLQRLCRTP